MNKKTKPAAEGHIRPAGGESQERGALAEEYCCTYLKKEGYTVEARNYHSRFGEIDIIARRGEYIVFVEVKARSSEKFGTAQEFVSPSKQKKIIKTAKFWMMATASPLQPRFDVIAVKLENGRAAEISHLENCFCDISLDG